MRELFYFYLNLNKLHQFKEKSCKKVWQFQEFVVPLQRQMRQEKKCLTIKRLKEMKNEQKREILELLSELPQSEKRDKAIQTMKEQLSFVDIPFMCIDNDDFQEILSEEQLEVIAEELSDYIIESGDFSEYLTLAEESAIERRPDLFSNQCNI